MILENLGIPGCIMEVIMMWIMAAGTEGIDRRTARKGAGRVTRLNAWHAVSGPWCGEDL